MHPQHSGQDTAETPVRTFNSLLQRLFSRHLMDMALLLVVATIFSDLRTGDGLFNDPDLWWHMASGRIVDQTHHFIRVEPYSFTVAGQSWIDPEWLSGLFFWLSYKHLALVGVYVASAIGIFGNVLLIYWRGCWRQANAAVSLWIAGLGVLLMTVNSSARTILFAYLALSVEMAILERAQRGRERMLWLLPPLFCIWINLHGSWLIGLAILALYIACGWFRIDLGIFLQDAFSAAQRKRLLLVLAVSVVLLFINPYGWRLLWNPFDMAFGQTLNISNVQEWQPLNLGWFVGKASVFAIVLMLAAHAVGARKWKLFDLALFFFAWYAAFAHTRFTFLAAVLTLPMIASDLTFSIFLPPPVQKTIPFLNGLIAAGALVVVAHFVPVQGKLQQAVAKELPLRTIVSLQPSWRTMNEDNFGGLMDFYGKPTFIDSRFDTFEHHGVMKDFLDLMKLHESLRLLDQYRIDHVLVKKDEALAYLLERTPGWMVLSREGENTQACVLFARSSAVAGSSAR
jgi:hypothetical protein